MTAIADLSMFFPTKIFLLAKQRGKKKKSIFGHVYFHFQRKRGQLQFCRKTESHGMSILNAFQTELQSFCSKLVIWIPMYYLDLEDDYSNSMKPAQVSE